MQSIQIIFHIVNLLVAFLAVGTAYFAIYRQAQPLILMYYKQSPDTVTLIDLVICNNGSGVARDVKFSQPIPSTWQLISSPNGTPYLDLHIPVLTAGRS